MRWVYVGRLTVAASIFVAAVFVWERAQSADTLVASLAFAVAMLFTAASAIHSETNRTARRTLGRNFFYLQTLFDLLLVTAVVHVTGGQNSQFAALYIVVIAYAALVLPSGGGLLIAALGNVLYFADVLYFTEVANGGHETFRDIGVWLQLVVFGLVALGSGQIGGRLREMGAGKEELVAALTQARLEATDILRNIRAGILTVDADGRLLYANPTAARLLSLPLDQRYGVAVLDELGTVAPELARALARTLREGIRITRAEGTIRTPGRTFPIGVTTTFPDEGGAGKPMSTATAIFQDISDTKRLESLHLRAERLEAVAELSASLAHEIKNPLAAIRSAIEQLSRRATADEDERTLGALIIRETDRLSRLLSEFLDFARVRVTRIERVDLNAIVRAVTNLVQSHPDTHGVIKVVGVPAADAIHIDGDDDLLHRATLNLVLNAVQAPARSEVRVEVGYLPADQLPSAAAFERGGAVLRVTDDGPGIPDEIRERLFDPFFTTKAGGSGLGLAVVHRAIEAHRGLVYVDSTASGTRFTVLLPLSQAGEPDGAKRAPIAEPITRPMSEPVSGMARAYRASNGTNTGEPT